MRSQILLGLAALALIVVDSVAIGVHGGSVSAAPPGTAQSTHVNLGLLPGVTAKSVASGGGAIWVLTARSEGGRVRRVVEEIDPKTDRVRRSFPVPSPAAHIFYGAHRVWLLGPRRVSALNPSSGRAVTRGLEGGLAAEPLAFHGSKAYLADVGRDKVLIFTAGSRLHTKTIAERGGPRAVVALSGAIQPSNHVKNLIPIIFRGANTSFLAEVSRLRPVIASAGKRAVWVHSAKGLIRITVPPGGTLRRGNNIASRKHFATDCRVRQIVMSPGGGAYVSIRNRHNVRSHRNLLYFSRSALRAGRPRPTAVRHGRQVRNLALNPAGGIVYADEAGVLLSWAP